MNLFRKRAQETRTERRCSEKLGALMGKTALVEADIELGKAATRALDDSGFRAKAILWLYHEDAEEWRFVVATGIVDDDGPRKAYECVQKAISKGGLRDELPLRRIHVVGVKDPLVRALRKLVKTGPGISTIRLSNNVIDGVIIEDAVVYRLT